MLFAYAYFMNSKLFQMDIKSIFLNGIINKEVYIEQSFGFESYEFSNHVYKSNKALYGLKQASIAWYERLSKFLIENGFTQENIDTTLFLKKKDECLLVV